MLQLKRDYVRALPKFVAHSSPKIINVCVLFEDVDAGAAAESSYKRAQSMPTTPTTPVTPSSTTPRGANNVWRSVFHPGSNLATKGVGANIFDRPQPNSPTVYDWYVYCLL